MTTCCGCGMHRCGRRGCGGGSEGAAGAGRRGPGHLDPGVRPRRRGPARIPDRVGLGDRDPDQGAKMGRGLTAAVAALDAAPPIDPAALLKQVGMTLVSKVGGASGPLYGTLFLRMAGLAPGQRLDGATFAQALRAGVDGVVARGKAERGDKTMLDALLPACDALDAARSDGGSLGDGLRAAAAAARDAVS